MSRMTVNGHKVAESRKSATKLSRRDLSKTVTFAAGAMVLGSRRAEARAQGKITLTQWYHQYGEVGTQEAAERYAQQFTEAHPDIEVEMVWVPGDYAAKLSSALLTDEGPDVYEGMPTVAMVQAGQVAPLDDIYTPEVKEDFHPNDLASYTIDDKLYAVKMVDDTGLLYYRKSMLEEAGVQPPTTMDEVLSVAQELDTGRVKGLFLGNDGGISALLTIAPWSAGSEFLVDNEIVFDNERTVAAYAKVRELNESGALLTGAPTDWWDPSAFTQGLAAMQWTGLWAMPAIKAALDDDFGIVPWPAFDAEGKPATFWGGWAEMANAKSKNLDAAKQLVNWLWIENTEIQKDWNLSYGFHVPPRRSVAAEAEPLETGPAAEAVQHFYDYGRVLPPQWTAAMGTYLTTALSNIVQEGADPAEQVKAAADQCREELTRVLG